jgi:hypothetical protein
MNSKTKEKFRKLTKFYNSLDFKNEAAESTGLTAHQLRVDLLESLFFDKQNPGTSAEIFEILSEQKVKPSAPSMGFPPTPAELMAMALYEAYQQQKADEGDPPPPPCTVYYKTAGDADGDNPTLGKSILYDVSLDEMCRKDLDIKDSGHIMMAKIDSDITSPVLRGSSIVESYLNYIPNIERSRCVPYLKAKFITTDNKTLVALDFLGAAKLEAVDDKSIVQLGADNLLTKGSKVSDNNFYGSGGTIQGMELFTMPQSLIAKHSKYADPFRPLMSLNGADINIYSAGHGFVSYKKASLKLTLFDRTKLNDVSFLLDPSRFGETVVELSAGWTHPDPNNIYGAVLNEMKVKDLYKIAKSDYSLAKASTMDINLSLANLGGGDITKRSALVSKSNTEDLRTFHKKISGLSRRYQALARKINPSETDAVEILPSIIVEPKDSKQAVPLDIDKIEDVHSRLGAFAAMVESDTESSNKITKKQLEELTVIIKGLSSTPENDGVKELKAKYEEETDKFRTFINDKEGKDFFLDEEMSSISKETHISLGKLLLNTMGLPIIAKGVSNVGDVQILMYNFNKYAGEMGYNTGVVTIDSKPTIINPKNSLAQFALEKEKLIEEIKSKIDENQKITVHDIINYVRGKIKNKYDPQFGIVSGNTSSDYGKAKAEYESLITKKNDLTQRKAKEEDAEKKTKIEEELTAVQVEIVTALTKINDLKVFGEADIMRSLGTSKIRMPKLKLHIESNNIVRPNDGGTPTSVFQVRYHIYDENEKPYEYQEAAHSTKRTIIQNAKDEGLTITPGTSFLEQLNEAKALEVIPREPDDKSTDIKYKIIGRRYAIKKAIKASMPSISYGTEGTAINNISISSISDKNIDTHFLLEARQKKDADDGAPEKEEKGISEYDAQKIHPVTLDVSMMGCTVLEYGQQLFVDLQTNTDLDNVYGIYGITHSLAPGSFITNVRLTPTFSGRSVTFKDMIDDLAADANRLTESVKK